MLNSQYVIQAYFQFSTPTGTLAFQFKEMSQLEMFGWTMEIENLFSTLNGWTYSGPVPGDTMLPGLNLT